MRLSRKIVFNSTVLILGLLLIGVASLLGLQRLRHDMLEAQIEFDELRRVERIEVNAVEARGLLSTPMIDTRGVRHALDAAIADLRLFGEDHDEVNPAEHEDAETRLADRAIDQLEGVAGLMTRSPGAAAPAWRPADQVRAIDEAMTAVGAMSHEMSSQVARANESANRQLLATRAAVLTLLVLVIAGSILASLWQFRSVMGPVHALRRSVAAVAGGRFDQVVDAPGDDELAELAHEFNRMARELDQFYRELERMVSEKSRELVRSERLASVGFLAAGVAHEINNPMSIIAGYAQATLQELRAGTAAPHPEVEKVLQIICEESFRCKAIVQKLLTMARSGDEDRAEVGVAQVVTEVVALVRGLPAYRDRHLHVQVAGGEDLGVSGRAGELKQVLLNLTVNALEASPPGSGEVWIEAQATDALVRLTVRDNGRGMGPEVLRHVFEPFFTTKRGSGERGTGLGLSICHAIIQAHAGRIDAESDGPGRGSRFVVELPRARLGAAHVKA